MKITLDYRNPTPSHCDVAVFVNGALAGVLTLRQEELGSFQQVIVNGLSLPHDEFLGTGDPGQEAHPKNTDEMHLLLLDYRRRLEGVARHIPHLPSMVEREAALTAYQNVCQQIMGLIDATGGLRRKQETRQ